jgi:hypothetical protein
MAVRVRLIVSIIAEDVYVGALESATPSATQSPANSLAMTGKKLLYLPQDPKIETIGFLANDIKLVFQRMYRE